MSSRTLGLSENVYSYMLDNSLRESEYCQKLRKETSSMEYGMMQISPEQGQFMGLLISLLSAKKVIEVGTFTGYSALCIAQSLPEDGKLIACDVSEEWTSIGRKYWNAAGLEHKIDLRIAPAEETLRNLLDESGTFDFAFIDADKVNYQIYYELVLQLLRTGGLLLVDNVLWSGSVADEENQEESTIAIRNVNRHIHQDTRVEMSMLPVGDGLTLVRKK